MWINSEFLLGKIQDGLLPLQLALRQLLCCLQRIRCLMLLVSAVHSNEFPGP
jgi:hypothetical protein